MTVRSETSRDLPGYRVYNIGNRYKQMNSSIGCPNNCVEEICSDSIVLPDLWLVIINKLLLWVTVFKNWQKIERDKIVLIKSSIEIKNNIFFLSFR